MAFINSLGIVIAVGIVLIAYWQFDLWSESAWLRVALFIIIAVVGAVMGQAKEVSVQRRRKGNPWCNAWDDLRVAYTSDEHGPAFLFRLLEWLMLAAAGSMFATVFSGQ